MERGPKSLESTHTHSIINVQYVQYNVPSATGCNFLRLINSWGESANGPSLRGRVGCRTGWATEAQISGTLSTLWSCYSTTRVLCTYTFSFLLIDTYQVGIRQLNYLYDTVVSKYVCVSFF